MGLADIAQVIRSKNAGPRRLTLDIMFSSDSDFHRAAQSPVSARSSVWSRRVTTVPSRRPFQRAAAWLTTTIRSSARKISSARSTPACRCASSSNP